MAHNPYTPPDAPVSTPDEPERERPKQIVWASWLLWASVLLGFVTLYVSEFFDQSMQDVDEEMRSYVRIFLIVYMAVMVAVYLWCIDRMRAGRNWARIVLLVLLILSVITEFLPGEYEDSAAYYATRMVDTVIQVTAMI